MANSDTPFGLKPVRYLNGSPWNGQFRVYYVPSTDSTAIFKGDAVKQASTGADSTGKYAAVTQATAGDAIRGVVIGFGSTPYQMYCPTDLENKYRAASTAMYLAVVDDPNVVFEVQEDSVGNSCPATDVGFNANLVVGSGSTSTGVSGMELDSSSAASTATLQLKIMGLVDREDNELGDNAKWEVIINNHQLKGYTGTTGVGT